MFTSDIHNKHFLIVELLAFLPSPHIILVWYYYYYCAVDIIIFCVGYIFHIFTPKNNNNTIIDRVKIEWKWETPWIFLYSTVARYFTVFVVVSHTVITCIWNYLSTYAIATEPSTSHLPAKYSLAFLHFHTCNLVWCSHITPFIFVYMEQQKNVIQWRSRKYNFHSVGARGILREEKWRERQRHENQNQTQKSVECEMEEKKTFFFSSSQRRLMERGVFRVPSENRKNPWILKLHVKTFFLFPFCSIRSWFKANIS